MKPEHNTDERVVLVVNAKIHGREAMDLVSRAARHAVATGTALPDELADMFELTMVERPSGSRYGVLNDRP